MWSKYIFLGKWFRNNFLKIEASVGLPQRRSVPRKDQSAERGGCQKEVMPKSPRKCTSFRETRAVISASPKAGMMASMLRLEVLVDGWR